MITPAPRAGAHLAIIYVFLETPWTPNPQFNDSFIWICYLTYKNVSHLAITYTVECHTCTCIELIDKYSQE